MSDEQFLTRMSTYPMVSSALGQLTNAYEATKNSNNLVKSTLEMAENGVKGVAQHTAPIVDKLQPQVSKLNSIGVNSLERLEKTFPVVKAPTDEVLSNTKQIYDSTLKPTVDYVAAPVTYSVEKVQNLTGYSTEKMQDVKEYSNQKVKEIKQLTNEAIQGTKQYSSETMTDVTAYTTKKVTDALNTPYGKTVLTGVDSFLETAETYVEKYLPESKIDDNNETCKMEVVPSKQTSNQLTRAASLTGKVRQRMFSKAMSDLVNLQTRSKETLNRLNFTVDLIQYAQTNLDSAKDKAAYYWEEISKVEETMSEQEMTSEQTEGVVDKSTEAMQDDDVETYIVEPKMTMERRGILLARSLAMQLRRGLNMTQESYKLLPESIQEKINNAQGVSESLFTSLTNGKALHKMPSQAMEQVRAELEYLKKMVGILGQVALTSAPLQWLGLKGKPGWVEEEQGDNNDIVMMESTQDNKYIHEKDGSTIET
ncbi:unnamed protein product [Owenia fusiformis]|uniref:Uncharacterized protein n=1 Tax=Owenia fusiformis TaxID=6347 RepID=A0A8J1Y477_OWEFU|nr:unnamed protein product [Owenia fusiformis]